MSGHVVHVFLSISLEFWLRQSDCTTCHYCFRLSSHDRKSAIVRMVVVWNVISEVDCSELQPEREQVTGEERLVHGSHIFVSLPTGSGCRFYHSLLLIECL